MRRALKIACAIIGLVAVVFIAGNFLARLPAEPASGGCYTGQLPGIGNVQLSLFLSDKEWPHAFIYREGMEFEGGYCHVADNSNGTFRVDIEDGQETNATLQIVLSHGAKQIAGTIFSKTNAAAKPFTLTRRFEHQRIQRNSGFLVHSWEPAKKASSEYPSVPDTTKFGEAINLKLSGEARHNVQEFTSSDIPELWESLWYGVGFQARREDRWQVRLLTNGLASFAVWRYEGSESSCGNLDSMAGRNFWWHGGKLQELKLTNLFQPKTKWQMEILMGCRKDFVRNGYDAGYVERLLGTKLDLDVFTLSPTGLQIYFNPYTTLAGPSGPYIAHVPYQRLRPFFKKEIAAAIP